MCRKSPNAVNYSRKWIDLCPPPHKYQLTKLLTWKPKGAHQAKCTLGICAKPWKHKREVQFTACAPCALHLLKISWQKLLTWTPKGANKSSQKHPGDMRDAIKRYARRTVHNLCNFCFSPRSLGYCNLQAKLGTLIPANLPSAVNYNRKSMFWYAASRQVL